MAFFGNLWLIIIAIIAVVSCIIFPPLIIVYGGLIALYVVFGKGGSN